jgi:hypothetical protein
MKKIKDAIQKAYQKERNRILSQIRKLKKQGYDTSDIDVPKIPKKKTEGSIRRLQKLTTRKIQEQASRVDYETGEIVSARQANVRAIRESGEARRKSSAPVSRPKPAPAPLPQAEEPLDEWKYVISEIRELIEQIPHKTIAYQKPPSPKRIQKDLNFIYSNVLSAFNEFLYKVDDTVEKKGEAIEILRSILADDWLIAQVYDSEDVQRSKNVNYTMFADAINSTKLKEALTDNEFEDISDEEAWSELAEDAFDVMDYL